MEGRPERLEKHVQDCRSWPVTDKGMYLAACMKNQAKIRKRTRHVDSGNCEEDADTVQILGQMSNSFSSKTTKPATSTPVQQNILCWASKQMQKKREMSLHHKLLKALLEGNVTLKFAENPFFLEFLNELQPSYHPPSRDMLHSTIMTEVHTSHVVKIQRKMCNESNLTICLDGWSDTAGASIYGFMVLKEEEETVLDIVDVSEHCHHPEFIRDETLSVLERSGINIKKAVIACVTDNPAVMLKSRQLLQEMHKNVVPIRCCLHAFNTIAHRIIKFPAVVNIVKNNTKLINFFTSSHIWTHTLHEWMKQENISHFLTTFCQTRWYSLAMVCLGVATFKRGFLRCAQLSGNGKYPKLRDDIRLLIERRHHFANNDNLVKILSPVVDAIGHLESSSATLADVFEQLIRVHQAISTNEIPDIPGFCTHALRVLGRTVRDFSDDIYFVALFLSPRTKQIAISRRMSSQDMIRACLKLAKNWGFSKHDVEILVKELICYTNQDNLFGTQLPAINSRSLWATFTGDAPYLRRFAMMVFAIVPHNGPVEKLFSSLGLLNTKSRNRIAPSTLAVLGMIKHDLRASIKAGKKRQQTVSAAPVDLTGFEIPVGSHNGMNVLYFEESGTGNDEVHEALDEEESPVTGPTDDDVIHQYFDVHAFQPAQWQFESSLMAPTVQQDNSSGIEDWSIDDIIIE